MFTKLVTKSVTYTCDIHGVVPWELCQKCLDEKCEHGVSAAGHCDKCSADNTWANAPITDEELQLMKQLAKRCIGELGVRYPTTKRDYSVVALLPKLLVEYEQLRSQSSSNS